MEKLVHKNMDDLLKRGEDLDKLMEKSKDVSNLSLDFYKNAKKTNKRCCSLYWLFLVINNTIIDVIGVGKVKPAKDIGELPHQVRSSLTVGTRIWFRFESKFNKV